ncbi:PorV/PorQ family protein, partial [Candidatus Margulisiibacteriota bacterium]
LKALILIFACSFLCQPADAYNGAIGTTTMDFLNLTTSVRAAAMGDTFVAIADDPSAIYWNPAGLTRARSQQLSSMHADWFEDINYTTFSIIKPLEQGAASGITINYIDLGKIEETTPAHPGGTGRFFSSWSGSLGLALAKKVSPELSLGGHGKFLSENIGYSQISGYALDLGLLLDLSPDVSVGVSARNMGAVSGVTDPLPYSFRSGLAFRVNPRFRLGCDFLFPNDDRSSVHVGGEYALNEMFCARLGFNTRRQGEVSGNYGLGMGIKLSSLQLDYAFVPYGELGATHLTSLNLSF